MKKVLNATLLMSFLTLLNMPMNASDAFYGIESDYSLKITTDFSDEDIEETMDCPVPTPTKGDDPKSDK